MDNTTPGQFLKKIANKTYTEQDEIQFREWLRTASPEQLDTVLDEYGDFFKSLPSGSSGEHTELFKKIEIQIQALEESSAPRPLWRRLSMASGAGLAAFTLILIIGLFFWRSSTDSTQPSFAHTVPVKIVPGGTKAILTLANGSTMVLDSVKNGIVAHQGNTTIEKSENGRLSYSIDDSAQQLLAGYNTITTPRGGEYRLDLPDGSKVWLNAGSSLRFPTAFTGDERKVELKGEAYFEVAKNKKLPFRVMAGATRVEVLGTHFNVSAYKDENNRDVTTTLLEGSVRIIKDGQSRVIRPGEKAIVSKTIEVAQVNAKEAIEWKNGNFNFSHESIESIMQKIARWYNVDIEYQGTVTTEGFVGTVPRSKDIGDVLERLELTGLVHFKIVERRIIVMP